MLTMERGVRAVNDKETLIAELTLVLLYLTGWKERDDVDMRSWRSYDWDALDTLGESGFVYGSRKNKSVYLTEEGEEAARKILSRIKVAADGTP